MTFGILSGIESNFQNKTIHHFSDRKLKATDATTTDAARLREGLLDKTNTASTVWADTAYRPKANEDSMEK